MTAKDSTPVISKNLLMTIMTVAGLLSAVIFLNDSWIKIV